MKCPRCGFELEEAGLTSLQPVECPSCGKVFAKVKGWESGLHLVRSYFSDVWKILTHPKLFFRHLPLTGGLSQPLAFALVTHWLGSILGFPWRLAFQSSLMKFFEAMTENSSGLGIYDQVSRNSVVLQMKDRVLNWLFGVGPVLLDPFRTLLSILVTSFFVFLGARILVQPGKKGRPTEITYESAVRIVSYGLTPSILTAIPFVGGFAASVGTVIVTVIGAREAYRVGTGRAIIVALFPKVLILGIIGMGVFLFALIIFKFFAAFV